MEHVIDGKRLSVKRFLQVIGSKFGIYQFLLDGCRMDKDLEKELKKSDFDKVDIKRFQLEYPSKPPHPILHMISPHVFGTATTKEKTKEISSAFITRTEVIMIQIFAILYYAFAFDH